MLASAFILGTIIIGLQDFAILKTIGGKYRIAFFILLALTAMVAAIILIKRHVTLLKTLATLSPTLLLKTGLCLLLIWLLLGSHFHLLINPLLDQAPGFIRITGLYTIAYSLGFITPFAPAGLGVRESVLVLGLAGHTTYETVIVASLVSRLVYVIGELLLAALSAALPAEAEKKVP